MQVQKILFPTDFSETADHAFQQAVALAIAHNAHLHIFHAVLLHSEDPRHLQTVLKGYVDHLEKEAQERLEKKSSTVKQRGLEVEFSTARGISPFETIQEKINELNPDLVVMGTHGRTGVGKVLLGSVAEKLLRHADCNVMTLRKDAAIAGEQNGLRRVLVPVDFTEFSRRALEAALALSSENGSLTLVHVVASPIHPSFYAGGITGLFQLDPDLPDRVRANLEGWLGDQPGEVVVTEGDPATEIQRVVQDSRAELIVMGTRGLSGVNHLLLGSVTEKVVRSAEVPVLIVK